MDLSARSANALFNAAGHMGEAVVNLRGIVSDDGCGLKRSGICQ